MASAACSGKARLAPATTDATAGVTTESEDAASHTAGVGGSLSGNTAEQAIGQAGQASAECPCAASRSCPTLESLEEQCDLDTLEGYASYSELRSNCAFLTVSKRYSEGQTSYFFSSDGNFVGQSSMDAYIGASSRCGSTCSEWVLEQCALCELPNWVEETVAPCSD